MTTKKYVYKEDWTTRKWRPYMAWTYMGICIFDFVIAPLVNYFFFAKTGLVFQPWKPLTMSEGGMFHMAMGAIVGVAAWQRGSEKITRYNNGVMDHEPIEPGK